MPTLALHSTVPRTTIPDDILDIIISHLWEGEGDARDFLISTKIASASLRLLRGARKKLYSHLSDNLGQIESVIAHPELGEFVRTINWIENATVESGRVLRYSKPFRRLMDACPRLHCIRIKSDTAEIITKNLQCLAKSIAATSIARLELAINSADNLLSTPIQIGNLLTSFQNLDHLSFSGIRLLSSVTCNTSLRSITLNRCNALSFTSLLECSPHLIDLKLLANEFGSIPLGLTTVSANLQSLAYDNRDNNPHAVSNATFYKELKEFLTSFSNLQHLTLWIPNYDPRESKTSIFGAETTEFLYSIPISILSINFTGPGSPVSESFGIVSNRWRELQSIKFGSSASEGLEHCCGWTEGEIKSLDFGEDVYYSVNEGRDLSDTFADLITPVYAHSYVFNPPGPAVFEECILDSDSEWNDSFSDAEE